MATVTPTLDRTSVNAVATVTWSGIATGDTIVAMNMKAAGLPAVLCSVQITGTFGGAAVTITASNDDVTYIAIADQNGTAISAGGDTWSEVSTGAGYLKPAISGGTGDSVDVIMTIWLGNDFR